MELFGLPKPPSRASLLSMTDSVPSEPRLDDSSTDCAPALYGAVLVPAAGGTVATTPNAAGQAALATARALARNAAAPATLRAYKADWAHYAAWCARGRVHPGAG